MPVDYLIKNLIYYKLSFTVNQGKRSVPGIGTLRFFPKFEFLIAASEREPGKGMMTIEAFRRRFGDEEQCWEHLTRLRWPRGFVCPRCGGDSRGYLKAKRVHECRACGYQGSVTAGTVFHKTRVALSSWFWAIYRMSQGKKGVSALQLSKEIGVSYPTAWLLAHKLRKAMADREEGRKLRGLIEVDEGYGGGKERGTGRIGRFTQNKSIVAVAVEHWKEGEPGRPPIPGRAALAVLPDVTTASVRAFLDSQVKAGSVLWTDKFSSMWPNSLTGSIGAGRSAVSSTASPALASVPTPSPTKT